jgi:hypothetical protein
MTTRDLVRCHFPTLDLALLVGIAAAGFAVGVGDWVIAGLGRARIR